MSKRLFDGAKITRVPYAKITRVPLPVYGLPYAKITCVMGAPRMQKLHAINNIHVMCLFFRSPSPRTIAALSGSICARAGCCS